jgi:hypothetical protein
MSGIPPVNDTDAEDVVWGLQTAASLWKRGERIDALVWLRRAAQAAGDANHDDRALELARFAAELTEWLANQPLTVIPPGDSGIDVEIEAPVDGSYRPPPSAPPPSQPTMQTGQPEFEPPPEPPPPPPPSDEGDRKSSTSVPPAAQVHAGMYDPWADQSSPAAERPKAIPPPQDSEEDVVTSLRPEKIASSAPPPAKAPAIPKPPPLPPRAKAPSLPKPPLPRPKSASVPESPPANATPLVPSPLTTTTKPARARTDAPPVLELEGVDAFSDLPDDARTQFAAAATVHELEEGEEASGFALAYVMRGDFDVSATMVDAPAIRLRTGAVLRARGTTNEGVPMRLIAAGGSGVVATWSGAAVEDAFRTCPWVEEDLRAASDRVMTIVGITIGPLGERLDQAIREQVVDRLKVRPLIAGEIVVNAGEPVPGLLLVGVGELELVRDGEVVGGVGSGDFLFPGEVLGAGAAPLTARAGPGGALVLFGDRNIAQELLVTCPPLLEVFAGM